MGDDDTPQEEARTIADTGARTYLVQVSFYPVDWYLKVRAGNSRAGGANCSVEGDAIHIDDIRIENEAPQREGFSLLRAMLKWHKEPINYRQRGLGSALLQLIERIAGERGFKRVTGDLSSLDLSESAHLPDWYFRRGFAVSPGASFVPHCAPGCYHVDAPSGASEGKLRLRVEDFAWRPFNRRQRR